jgi:pimeloyl-ACP methyl ester carboxylesterase
VPVSPNADAVDDVLVTPAGRHIGWFARGPVDGTPVLYVHGWPGSRLEQCLIPGQVLRRFGVRLVSVDRPGYGNTDPLAGERTARVGDVLAVADALGIDRFPVMGFSGGGSNVLTLAAVAPERVTRVVCVSGEMPWDDDEAIATSQPEQLAELVMFRAGRTSELQEANSQLRSAFLEDAIGALSPMTATLSPREQIWYSQQWVKDTIVAEVTEGLRNSGEGSLDDSLISVRPFDIDLASVQCPVLAVHGSADDWEPLPNLRRVLELVPDRQLLVLEGLNHFGPLLYPGLLLSLTLG